MGKGRSLGGSFWVKSPELDESGEGTTHDHRSLRTKAATGAHWAIKSDWRNSKKNRYETYVFYCRKWSALH